MTEVTNSSGVQELIDRLSDEGVAEGQRQAEAVVAEAQQKAGELLDAARRQAIEIRQQAQEEAERFRQSGEEALRLACRDGVRDLQNQIHEGFRQKLRRLVSHTLKDNQLLKQLIQEVAGKAAPGEQAGPLELLLSEASISDAEVTKRIQAGDEDALIEFVRAMTGDVIREGVDLRTTDDSQAGFRIRVVEDDVEIELTETAISDVLARYLLPRFRAVMRNA